MTLDELINENTTHHTISDNNTHITQLKYVENDLNITGHINLRVHNPVLITSRTGKVFYLTCDELEHLLFSNNVRGLE